MEGFWIQKENDKLPWKNGHSGIGMLLWQDGARKKSFSAWGLENTGIRIILGAY